MKLLALLGSLLLVIYIVATIVMTSINISKLLFELNRHQQSYRFWSRQGLIFLWPLVCLTEDGRTALNIIWEGKNL